MLPIAPFFATHILLRDSRLLLECHFSMVCFQRNSPCTLSLSSPLWECFEMTCHTHRAVPIVMLCDCFIIPGQVSWGWGGVHQSGETQRSRVHVSAADDDADADADADADDDDDDNDEQSIDLVILVELSNCNKLSKDVILNAFRFSWSSLHSFSKPRLFPVTERVSVVLLQWGIWILPPTLLQIRLLLIIDGGSQSSFAQRVWGFNSVCKSCSNCKRSYWCFSAYFTF